MAAEQQHWDGIYGQRAEDALTWFEAVPSVSLGLVRAHLGPGEAFIDIGGGASRLVDALIELGLGPLSVLDISGAALKVSKKRLGARAQDVTWIDTDLTKWQPDRDYALWHDRAVFHFLTKADDRAAYARAMTTALGPHGTAIIATFAEDGPQMCSGLPVVRYSPESLAAELDRLHPGLFDLIDSKYHTHTTPKGNGQRFQYSVFRKKTP